MRRHRQTSGWAAALVLVLFPLTLGNDGCEGYQSTGSLGQVCGLDAGDCATGEYCRYEGDRLADGQGVCTEVTDLSVCAEIYQPVCGLDGRTYGNACIAAAMGASIVREGECVPDDTGCIALWEPVCGDDGVTYGNACEAGVAGVTVVSQGACGGGSACPEPAPLAPNEICIDGSIGGPICTCDAAGCRWELRSCPTSRACGGFAGLTCEAGEFCDLGIGQCQVADGLGYCRPQPTVCTADYAPVCGCDGHTYSNECHAAGLGVGVDHLGACGSSVCDPADCGAPPLSPLPHECVPSDAAVSPPECVWTPTCYPTPCAAPPPGCHYEGGDVCSCGSLVCDRCELVDCAQPPAGCTYVADGSCCGALSCPEPQLCDPTACGPVPAPTVPYVCARDAAGVCSWTYPYPTTP